MSREVTDPTAADLNRCLARIAAGATSREALAALPDEPRRRQVAPLLALALNLSDTPVAAPSPAFRAAVARHLDEVELGPVPARPGPRVAVTLIAAAVLLMGAGLLLAPRRTAPPTSVAPETNFSTSGLADGVTEATAVARLAGGNTRAELKRATGLPKSVSGNQAIEALPAPNRSSDAVPGTAPTTGAGLAPLPATVTPVPATPGPPEATPDEDSGGVASSETATPGPVPTVGIAGAVWVGDRKVAGVRVVAQLADEAATSGYASTPGYPSTLAYPAPAACPPDGGPIVAVAITGDDGTFYLEGLAPGNYRIAAEGGDGSCLPRRWYLSQSAPATGEPCSATVLELRPDVVTVFADVRFDASLARCAGE